MDTITETRRGCRNSRCHDGNCRRAAERRSPSEHLEQYASQRIDIASPVDTLTRNLLRTHVRGRAYRDTGARDGLVARCHESARNSEIGYDRVALLEENVSWFHITMDDAALVSVGESLANLCTDDQRHSTVQCGRLRQAILQRQAGNVRHYVKQERSSFTRVVERQDVRMAEAGCNLDLTEKTVRSDIEVFAKDLERNVTIMPDITRKKHGRHAAASELTPDEITISQRFGDCLRQIGHSPNLLREAVVSQLATAPSYGIA